MKRSETGVTLIELLIAVTLVALLAVGMMIAMRVGLSAMYKSNDRLMSNRRVASVEKILDAEINGIIPVKAKCGAVGENPGATAPFFQGDIQAMRLVSTYSLQQATRGLPMILEFHVIPGEDGAGVRLVVNEHMYTGPLSSGAFCAGMTQDITGASTPNFLPIETNPSSFVLADKLAYCKFSYRFLAHDPKAQPIWLVHWNKPLLPSAIRVEMAPLEPNSAKLQFVPLTIPIRVTKDPMKDDYEY